MSGQHIPAYHLKHLFVLVVASFLLASCDSSQPPPAKKEMTVQEQGSHVTLMIHTSHLGAADEMARLFLEGAGNVVRIISVEYHEIYEATLDEFYKKNAAVIDVDDLIPHFFDRYTLYRGMRWAVPFDGDIHVLFYRKSLFAKHNLSPPSTWKEYLEVVKFITEKEKENNIYGAAFMAYPTPFLIVGSFLNRLGGFGGKLVDEKMKPRVYSPEAVRALEAMVEHAKYTFPSTLEVDFAVARDAFIHGKVGMVEQWTDVGIMAEDSRQSIIKGDWGVVPMPIEQDIGSSGLAPLNAGWSLAISSKSKKRALAEQFLLFATRKDITLKLNLIPGGGGVVESYDGKICVASQLGKGATFTIYLPITKKSSGHKVYVPDQVPTGSEHILFIDDEYSIAKIGCQILERLGYTVTTRTSSIEALELFQSKPNDFDLVVTDMTMPYLTGEQLSLEMMRIRPDIPVILCTGYSKNISNETTLEIGIKALAYKPIVKADLANTVRNVLDAAKS